MSPCDPAPGALDYNSDAASVKPVVQLTIPTDTNAQPVNHLYVQFTFNGTTQSVVTYTTTGVSPGDVLTINQQAATIVTATGRYLWSATITITNDTNHVTTIKGTAYAVVQDASSFGSGWTFAPTDQLISFSADANGPAGVLRVFGTGGSRFYASDGHSGFNMAPGDSGTTFTLSGGTYTYQDYAGDNWIFNSNGLETQWASADSHRIWQYRYDGHNHLTGITAPDGALTTLAYNATTSLVSSISTVSGRITTLAYSGTNLTSITNPDSGQHTLAYDSNNHVTGETFGLLQNEWTYSAGKSVSVQFSLAGALAPK
jgi:YD repeat-containing protein